MSPEYKPPVGSVAALLEKEFGVKVTERENPLITSVGATAEVFLTNHPGRVGFVFINLSANAMYIRPGGTPSSTAGIYVAPSGGYASANFKDDFGLPTREWSVVAGGAASALYCLSLEVYGN